MLCVVQIEACNLDHTRAFRVEGFRRDGLDLREAVFHELPGIAPAAVGRGIEHHGDEVDAVAPGGAHEAVARSVGEACFDAGAVGIVSFMLRIEDVCPADDGSGRMAVDGCRQVAAVPPHDGSEALVLHGGLRDDGHIPHGGIVVLVVDAGGIGEMGEAGAAQHVRRVVHEDGKVLRAAADILGNRVRAVVAGLDERRGDEVLHPDLFPGDQRNLLIGRRHAVHGIAGDRHHIVTEIRDLQGDKGGEDLRGGCGVEHFVSVLFVDHFARVRLNQNSAAGVQHLVVQQLRMVAVPGDGVRVQLRLHILDGVPCGGLLFGECGETGKKTKTREKQCRHSFEQSRPSILHFSRRYSLILSLLGRVVQQAKISRNALGQAPEQGGSAPQASGGSGRRR